MKPYTVNAAPIVQAPLAGMDYWITRAIRHSNKCLWNNGSWMIRDIKNKPGTISNHAKGVAVDLSYRYNSSNGVGRRKSLPYIIKLLQNAETLGIELVIDYALMRSWKCDRGTWIKGNYQTGDWYHIEVNPVIAHSEQLAKQAWDKVFGVIPAVIHKPV